MGRGRSKGAIRVQKGGSVIVDYGASGFSEFREGPDGKLFNETTSEVLNIKMSLSQVATSAKNSGYQVTTFTKKQTEDRDKASWEERGTRPDYELGIGMKDNRQYRKRARQNRLMTRIMRKG